MIMCTLVSAKPEENHQANISMKIIINLFCTSKYNAADRRHLEVTNKERRGIEQIHVHVCLGTKFQDVIFFP